jgi:hypothetical protein
MGPEPKRARLIGSPKVITPKRTEKLGKDRPIGHGSCDFIIDAGASSTMIKDHAHDQW